MRQNLVGLSLSLCIKDIIEKDIAIDRIKCIISGTRMITDNDYIEVFQQYKQSYWSAYSDKAHFILYHLRHTKKIVQPRLDKELNDLFFLSSSTTYWWTIEEKTF